MTDIRISFMELMDIPESVKVLSIAMLNNPLHIAVFKGNGEKERQEIEKSFLDLFNTLPGIVFLAKEGHKIVGVMRMKSCLGQKARDASKGLGDANDSHSRLSILHREWSNRDPRDQHWHLGPIGVLPPYCGRGIGSKLMERFCEEVDRCAAKAFLETDLDVNVRFYENFGFKTVSQTDIFDVTNHFMARDSQQ